MSMLSFFGNLSIRNKILAVNAVALGFWIVVGVINLLSLHQVYEHAKFINEQIYPAIRAAKAINFHHSRARIKLYKLVLTEDAEKAAKIWDEEYLPILSKLDKAEKDYEAIMSGNASMKDFGTYQKKRTEYDAQVEQIIQLMKNEQYEDAKTLLSKKNAKTMQKMLPIIDQLTDLHEGEAEQKIKASEGNYKNVMTISLVLGLASLLTTITLSLYLAGKISKPLCEITQLASAVASGDLRDQVKEMDAQDELGSLSRALGNMVNNLRTLISDIKNNAVSVASSSEELSITSTQMRKTASAMSSASSDAFTITEELDNNIKTVAAAVEQSSANVHEIVRASSQVTQNINTVDAASAQVSLNLQTIASASEEMSSAVNTVASAVEEMSASLNEVSKQASQAARVAGKADQTAEATRGIMDTLGDSAREIGNIVELIKGIASQTNLLALNATIEAASAGEAGKGFAVVANEVKELAKQSAEATEEIRLRIETMQKNTDSAVSAIAEITEVISELNQISHTIASAVEEQTATANEISSSVNGAAHSSAEISANVVQAANVAQDVTKQVQEATISVAAISRNLEEVSKGSNEIANSAGQAANRATRMTQNIESVNDSSTQTESGAEEVQVTSLELARLAATLEKTVEQFAL